MEILFISWNNTLNTYINPLIYLAIRYKATKIFKGLSKCVKQSASYRIRKVLYSLRWYIHHALYDSKTFLKQMLLLFLLSGVTISDFNG